MLVGLVFTVGSLIFLYLLINEKFNGIEAVMLAIKNIIMLIIATLASIVVVKLAWLEIVKTYNF